MQVKFNVFGKPRGKQRPRLCSVGGRNIVYTPKQTIEYEKLIKASYIASSKVFFERNIPIVELKKIADGRIFTASQAKKHNLIDEISSYNQMIIDLEKNELFNTYYKIKNFEYQPEFSLANFIFGSITKTSLGKAISSEFQKGSLTYPAFIYK